MKAVRTVELGQAADPTLDLAMDTLRAGKQAIIFCNSKRSAEKTAEDLAKKIKLSGRTERLAKEALAVISPPTKQCQRLHFCLSRGTAFHHAGLPSKQRELIEDAFREGILQFVCATPTLAAGVDLPAFRTIIKDLRRFSQGYYQYIPVMEYHQMAGRAGRPGKEDRGEAICIAKDGSEAEELLEKYLFGPPETIYSKLAVEPVLRTYCLSLICSRVVRTEEELFAFFGKTFWAHQFQDPERLAWIIRKVLSSLLEWAFIGEDAGRVMPTRLGMRVSQLYLDPLTAHELAVGLSRTGERAFSTIGALQLIASTLEMRPLLALRAREYEEIEGAVIEHEPDFLSFAPSHFDYEYEQFLSSVKTARFLEEWMEELTEQDLLERYSIRPGEIAAKRDIADWLLYSCQELAKLISLQELLSPLQKLRVRLKYGIKEELLPLVQLRNIGRARARNLHRHGIRTLADVRAADIGKLSVLIGTRIAQGIKSQVGAKQAEQQKLANDASPED